MRLTGMFLVISRSWSLVNALPVGMGSSCSTSVMARRFSAGDMVLTFSLTNLLNVSSISLSLRSLGSMSMPRDFHSFPKLNDPVSG